MKKYEIGPNTIFIDGDLMFSVIRGVTTRTMVDETLLLAEQIVKTHGRILFLADATDSHPIEPSARRCIAEWVRTRPVIASATFGPGRIPRLLISLMLRAVAIVSPSSFKVAFFDTEAAARSWLDTQRREFLAHETAPAGTR